MIASAFHRVKYNIELTRQTEENAARKKLARGRFVLGGLTLFLRRLPLGANARNHLPHLPHADPVGNLELDLVVVDYLGDFADQPARGDNGVAAADVLYEFGVVLHLLLL